MNSIKNLFEKYTKDVSLNESKKADLWKDIASNTTSESESFWSKLNIFGRRAAPAIFGISMLYVGVNYYKNNIMISDLMVEDMRMPVEEIQSGKNGSESYSTSTDSEPKITGNVILKDAAPASISNIVGDISKSNETEAINIVTDYYVEDTSEDNVTDEADRSKDIDAYFMYLVDDVKVASDQTYKKVVEFDGVVYSANLNVDDSSFIVRIPVAKFAEFRDSISSLAEVIKVENVDIQDREDQITEYSTSLADMNKDLKKLEADLKKETKDSAKAILRNKIAVLKSKIERTKKSLESVEEQVEMADVRISYRLNTETFSANMRHTLTATLQELGDTTVTFVNGAIVGLYFAIPLLAVYFLVKKLVRKFGKKK